MPPKVLRNAIRSLVPALVVLGACSTAQKQAPHLFFSELSMEAQLDRDDLIVLDTVEGSSSTTSILGGLIQIIDGDKLKLFWIPFFTDKYTYLFSSQSIPIGLPLGVGPEDRAYYKALEKAPDADSVLQKSMDREDWGVPILYNSRTVTWRGKAVALRANE